MKKQRNRQQPSKKQQRRRQLRFHTIFSVCLSAIFLIILLINRDITLGVTMLFLAAYVIGNGIIHMRHKELTHDTILEYFIVSVIVLVLLVGLFYKA